MTRLTLRDDILDAQSLRAAGAAAYGGADLGEVIATARRVKGTNLDSWHDAWADLAARTLSLAEAQLVAGRTETARLAFLRSCTYDRTAGLMLMGVPVDPRLIASNRRQIEAFRRAVALLPMPPEILHIPYEGTSLPGYFFRVDDDPRPRKTVVLINGYDGTAEELYVMNARAALARGYNVLMFDGPGQGSALIQHGLLLRPDWEAVMTPVLDLALARPDVDPARVALVGLSLGGYLAPRAASVEHRFAACVADCGSYDMFASATSRIPGLLVEGLGDPTSRRGRALRRLLDLVASRPTAGWALRRGMQVHGAGSPAEYLEMLRDYTLRGHASNITCPTFVCSAEGDDISASAPELVAELTCPKEYVRFTAAEGAGDHCEIAARQLYHARSFSWLDSVLARPG